MKKTLKQMLIGVILAAFGVIVAIFIVYRQTPESAELPSFQKSADISIAKVRQTATRDGVQEWTLDAASARFTETEKQAIFKTPEVTFFLEDGKSLYLTAKEGIVNTDSDNIEAKGQVVLKKEDYSLATEQIKYEKGSRIFSADAPIKVVGNEVSLSADAMTFDLNTNRLFFKGNVKGVFNEKFSL